MKTRLKGRIAQWNHRGFGWIRNESGTEFVHIGDVRSGGVIPVVGDYVEYSVGKSPDGRRRAVDVTIDGAPSLSDTFADR